MRKFLITPLFLFVFAISTFAQQPFNKTEFAARRAKLFEKIPDGIAVVFAAKGQNTVLIRPTGAVNMTAGAPASLDEVYALIRESALSLRH